MTDGTNSLWYANKTLSATRSIQYGLDTFFSYTAEMDRMAAVTFEVMPNGMGFFFNGSSRPGPVYYKGATNSSLCLRTTFPFLALVRNDVISWDEATNPPAYQEGEPLAPRPIILAHVQRPYVQRPQEETLPAYNQVHEMEGVVSTLSPAARTAESDAVLSASSRRVSVAPSVTPSEVLSLESWSVEEVAGWVRLNGAGLSGAEKVRTLQMDGGVLKQLTVEEILRVFSLEDEYEIDKLREALAVLKANNGETPPEYEAVT
ncbi:hypothetical protein HDU77_002857 [Chytriomyces hyalinus]|nr:hypothetical protein HDU77_002857 [Chytriomyces hyalinus]